MKIELTRDPSRRFLPGDAFSLSRDWTSAGEGARPDGLIMLQIDGLAYTQSEQALKNKRLPFLKQLLEVHGHHLHPFCSGIPSTTPAVQAELFFGVKCAVPAFQFVDRARAQTFTMDFPWSADHVAQGLSQHHHPLLTGGRSYANIYIGGAEQARYCVQSMRLDAFLKAMNPLRLTAVLVRNIGKLFRIAGYACKDLALLCRHPNAGDLVLSGWRPRTAPMTFAVENGAHGGLSRDECRGFALLPFDLQTDQPFLRALDLRRIARRLLATKARAS